MRFFIFFISIIFLVFLNFSQARPEESKKEIVIKFASIAPEGSSWVKVFREMEKELKEKTGGGVKISYYGGGTMGDEPDMVRKLRMGQLQMAAFTIQGIRLLCPEMAVLILPFIFDDIKEVDFIRERMFDTFEKYYDDHGTILLSWIDMGGFAQFFTKNPIRNPEDLSKQKNWRWAGERLDQEILKALNVNSIIPSPLFEVKTMLKTGMIDSVYNSPLGAVALQWYSEIDYITMVNLAYGPAVVVATKKFWKGLTPELRDLIGRLQKKYAKKLIKVARRDDDIALLGMTKRGIKLIKLTPEERDVFVRKTKVIWDKLADDLYPRSLLDEVLKNLEEYRAGK